jgi:hypothetical protein
MAHALLQPILAVAVGALLGCAQPAFCFDDGRIDQYGNKEPLLQPYEPITASYTKQSNDVPFLDVTLSLKYRLLPTQCDRSTFRFLCTGDSNRLFFAMTTRFGFYWGTREGSPVVGKSYNPKLLWRHVLNEGLTDSNTPDSDGAKKATGGERANGGSSLEYTRYLDFAYAHESNGQLIHTQAQYIATQMATNQSQYTNDSIHRGWDYLEVTWKDTWKPLSDNSITTYVDGKYFLPVGLLQGDEDQYHNWENNPQGKSRDEVDGLSLAVRYQAYGMNAPILETEALSHLDVQLKYGTGYHSPFSHSTVRAELGFEFYTLPLAVWVQDGYMSDLAMYYDHVKAAGIELRIRQF